MHCGLWNATQSCSQPGSLGWVSHKTALGSGDSLSPGYQLSYLLSENSSIPCGGTSVLLMERPSVPSLCGLASSMVWHLQNSASSHYALGKSEKALLVEPDSVPGKGSGGQCSRSVQVIRGSSQCPLGWHRMVGTWRWTKPSVHWYRTRELIS